MINNYTDNICELEKAANIFAPIDNAEIRAEIQTKFTKWSKTLCDQRKYDNLIDQLKFDITGEKDAHQEELKIENGKQKVDANAKYFNEKMAKFSEEQKDKFRIRKARQVLFDLFEYINWRLALLKLSLTGTRAPDGRAIYSN
jgi:hypothetical protein